MPCNANLHTRGICQVNDMVDEAIILRPIGLTTGALIEVTLLWAHDTAVASSQFFKARKAIPLIEALVCFPGAMHTVDDPGKFKRNVSANQRIERYPLLTNR